MGMPVLIGAGVGALGSAAMGKSPLTGALMGGSLGGLGGSAGLFGEAAKAGGVLGTGPGGFLEGLKGVSAATPSFGSGGYAALASNAAPSAVAANVPAGFTSLGGEIGPSFMSGPGIATASGQVASGAIPLTGMDKALGAFNKITAPFENFAMENPILARVGGNVAANQVMDTMQPTPQQPVAQPLPVNRPNFDPSSTLMNVSPSPTPSPMNKTGMIDLKTTMPMTDEEKLRLQQLMQLGYRG